MEHRHARPRQRTTSQSAFTKNELQDFLDHADDQALNCRFAPKGWLPAYRDR